MAKPKNRSLSINKGKDIHDSVNPAFRAKKVSLKQAEEYADGISRGDRAILSQAITLIESTKGEYRELGQDVLNRVLPLTGKSVRIGITGVPGVGKSTFIEAMGRHIIQKGKRLAVLAIDPSSSRSKGSILGDKTRMQWLSTQENAFIRPSPTSGTLGGVAQKTRETMLLCEAAGYDTIFIETVGVGQSETTVHSMVDFFLLLMLAGAGDELQGIKRGIMEMADLIAINKAEGENLKAAKRAQKEYQNALSLFPPSPSGWEPGVLTCSAVNRTGIEEIWKCIEEYIPHTRENDYFSQRRKEQAAFWMHESIHRQLKDQFYSHPDIQEKIQALETEVKAGRLSPFNAASQLMDLFRESKG
jgi:LAO/AO transport system kinase